VSPLRGGKKNKVRDPPGRVGHLSKGDDRQRAIQNLRRKKANVSRYAETLLRGRRKAGPCWGRSPTGKGDTIGIKVTQKKGDLS